MSALIKKYCFDKVFDSQKVFRLILEAMSNPGRVVNIKEYADKMFGDYNAFLTVAMTLLDNEVSFYACGNQPLSEEIMLLTLAKAEKIESADFVFVCDPYDIKNVIENVKCGTLADPHRSVAVIIRNDGEPAYRLTLSGPGINGYKIVSVPQVVIDAICMRNAQYFEYPQGIDLLFISSEGELLAIPRLTHADGCKGKTPSLLAQGVQ